MRARKDRFSFGSKERIILLFSRLRRTYCYMCGEEHGEENFSMKKRIAALLGVLLLFALTPCAAWAEELLVGGQAVGIEINADGVIVSGFCEVQTEKGVVCPAREAGFAVGDLIVGLDGAPIRSAEDLIAAAAALGGSEAEVEVLRGGETQRLRVCPALSETRQWLLGLWLRDGVSGIGTITFIEPRSGLFGALGHSVNDESSGRSVPLREGWISAAEIVSVSPGVPGTPGELCGGASAEKIGSVEKNTAAGIFGHLSGPQNGRLVQTGEIRTGRASIVSTLAGHEAKEYAVEIDRVYSEGGQTHALLTVTDAALSSGAGGIVQGMSGSPILQDGSIVGAVTHVFVNDPRRGFAIGIYDMLDAAGAAAQAA